MIVSYCCNYLLRRIPMTYTYSNIYTIKQLRYPLVNSSIRYSAQLINETIFAGFQTARENDGIKKKIKFDVKLSISQRKIEQRITDEWRSSEPLITDLYYIVYVLNYQYMYNTGQVLSRRTEISLEKALRRLKTKISYFLYVTCRLR